MADGSQQARDVEEAIFLDEVGLEIGIHGDYRLKTSYQPIFRREGPDLVPFAVEARVAPLRAGARIAVAEFFDEVAPSDRQFVEAVCRTLHLRNHRNIGVEDPHHLQLYLTIDPGLEIEQQGAGALASIADMIEAAGLSPGMIICEIVDAPTRGVLAGELRGYGARVSVSEFRVGKSAIDRISRIEPDIIKIDGAWFRNVQDSAETARLFPAVITSFQGLGAKLLVQGIETPAELSAALDSGADYLQGMFLAKPALAGTDFDERPRSIRALLQSDRKVIKFAGNHQKR